MLGIGLAMMASLWTLAALLGLESVFKLFPWAYVTMKTLGALYLFYTCLEYMATSAKNPLPSDKTASSRSFRDGFLLNLAKPEIRTVFSRRSHRNLSHRSLSTIGKGRNRHEPLRGGGRFATHSLPHVMSTEMPSAEDIWQQKPILTGFPQSFSVHWASAF